MSNKVQFFHSKEVWDKKDRRHTYAVEVPGYDEVVRDMVVALTGGEVKREIKLGVATVHPSDAFVKAVGREKSLLNMNNTKLSLIQHFWHESQIEVVYSDGWHNVVLRLVKGHVRLLDIYKKGTIYPFPRA